MTQYQFVRCHHAKQKEQHDINMTFSDTSQDTAGHVKTPRLINLDEPNSL